VVSPVAGADLSHNRALWTIVNSEFTDEHADRAWAAEEITWGLFQIPDRDLGVLGDVANLDVVELGCGTAYLSGLLARQGARPVGVDLTPAQLATAARCQQRFGLTFPLIEANAEQVPLPDASFDLVVSEYGASVWCDPARWVAEAARLLRTGGRLVFLTNSVLATLCVPHSGGVRAGAAGAAATSAAPGAMARRRDRVPPQPRRLDPHPARQLVRDRSPPRALRPGGRGDPRVLRHRHRPVGQEMAGGRPLGRAPQVIERW
jgi:SAM-dependent methyltransferase